MFARDPGVVSDDDALCEAALAAQIADARDALQAEFDRWLPDAMADARYDACHDISRATWVTAGDLITDAEMDEALLEWVRNRIDARAAK